MSQVIRNIAVPIDMEIFIGAGNWIQNRSLYTNPTPIHTAPSWYFDHASAGFISTTFSLPADFVSISTIELIYSQTAADTNQVIWELDYAKNRVGVAISGVTTAQVPQTPSGTTVKLLQMLDASALGWAAHDIIGLVVRRRGDIDASAVASYFLGVRIKYKRA